MSSFVRYFKPHKQKQEKENRVHGTSEFDLIVAKRVATDAEVKTLQTNLETIAMDHEWKRHMFASDGDGLSGKRFAIGCCDLH